MIVSGIDPQIILKNFLYIYNSRVKYAVARTFEIALDVKYYLIIILNLAFSERTFYFLNNNN